MEPAALEAQLQAHERRIELLEDTIDALVHSLGVCAPRVRPARDIII